MPPLTADQRDQIRQIAVSFERLTGLPLVPPREDLVQALWTAPFAIAAHGTQPDPIFFFGNATALELFEADFATFITMPSRLSAEPLLREERARLLERVSRNGFIDDYTGIRISSAGRRFRIKDAKVWNLTGDNGAPVGQAAAFSLWTRLD